MRGDAVDALKKCAEALQLGNPRRANAEMGRVLNLAEEETEPTTRRLIGYFAQALACRAYGLHPKYLSFPLPDWEYWMCAYYGLFHIVGRCISDVVKGKCKVHVIELVKHIDGYEQWASIFGVTYNWGDLTHLRLSFLVQENVEFSKENEKELNEIAASRGIELECKIIAVNSFADIDVSLLEMRDGEFVVVNCMFVFSKMLSEALALKKLLEWVRDVMRPNIMIVVEHDANHNQSDFLLRFDESLEYYSSLFEDYNPFDTWDAYLRYQIGNIVACEGSNRVERHQTWAQWKFLLTHYGFSIFNLFTEWENEEYGEWIEDGIFVITSGKTEKRPVFFVSAWETLTSPSKSSGSNEGLCIISSESDCPQTFQISPEDLYLIRMASLVEIHDILQNLCRQDKMVNILTWANPVWSAYCNRGMGSPLLLKTILCFEDAPCCPNFGLFDARTIFRWQYKEGEGILGKALKYNRPFYVHFTELKENVCPYINNHWRGCSFGALAIKLSSVYANCGDYVVEFWLQSRYIKPEAQEPLVHRIIDYLKDVTPRFVTYGNQDPLVELPEHDTPVSGTMLVRSNPPSQSSSDFNLNLINQTDGNAMDGQLPMQQLHYSGVLDAMPTEGNLQAQSTDAFGSKGKTFVDNPRDGNVLQWPHEQGPPIQLHVSATSNIKASSENIVAPPFGDFNLNGRISSSRINQTAEYYVKDMQVPHKQGIKRQRISRSDVWNHYEKVEVVDGELLAKCKYCDFKTDGSSKKGTSHLRKHFENRHKKIKNVHQSSNLPSKNLELQSAFKERYVLDEDKIHLDMARVIIKYKLPLSIIHDEHLKNLFKMLQPEFEFQSEKDLERRILDVYNEEKHKLCKYFDKLSCCFNLTINLWKDNAKGMVNCCLTAQFIDDSWELKKKVLTFERFENDSGAVSWSKVFKVLSDWIINVKICSLTIHNSFSNDEIVHDKESWPSGIFYLSYDKCISDINYMAGDISLKSIYQVYKEVNYLQNKGYTLMSVECNNDWRICSLILAVVTILHPYLKLKFVQFVYEGIYGAVVAKQHLNEISNFLTSLYDKYADNCTNQKEFITAIGDTCCSSQFNTNDKVLDSFRKYLAFEPNRLELYQYLEEKECSMEIDILKWWQNNSSKFPTMVKMARDFLAIPWSTIESNSTFTTKVKKIVSNNSDQDLKIINAMVCYHDWLISINRCNENCDEKLMREPRVWSEKDTRGYLVWDLTEEDLQLLRNWENHKSTGQLKVQEIFLDPLVIPLVDATIGGKPEDYYIGDEIMNAYFDLLTRRSEENPNMFLKHDYLDSSTASILLNGGELSVPRRFTPEKQSNTHKLFFPLCLSSHWTLFYVNIKDKKFVWLNSLKGSEVPDIIEKKFRSWFENTLLPAMGLNNVRNWPLVVPTDIPKQQNGIDCGIFVMKYADCLTHAKCIGFPFSQDDMPHFRKCIFLEIYKGRIYVPEKFVGS